MFQVEPEARLSGAGTQSQCRDCFEEREVWSREAAEACPLTHLVPFPSSSGPLSPSRLATQDKELSEP